MTLLRTKEATKLYAVSRSYLIDLVKSRTLTEYKTPGGHRRYSKEELDALFSDESFAMAVFPDLEELNKKLAIGKPFEHTTKSGKVISYSGRVSP